MVNRQSEVIGAITFKVVGGENLNFAIPVNYLRGLMDSPVSVMSLEDLRARLANASDVFKSDAFPTRWKALPSGRTMIIRRDGDRIYVEAVLPEAEKNAGCFQSAELQKKGEIYAGKGYFSCVCQYTQFKAFVGRVLETNQYRVENAIEISMMSPTRIEGRVTWVPEGTKLDCEKGKYSKPPSKWGTFAWIPE